VLAVPPVIPLMHQSFALSQAAIGALTSLPVLLFSFAAIPGSLLVARFGPAHVLTAGILVTALAGASRALAMDTGVLLGMTFLMGIGIAIMQPALPAIVRDWVPARIALGTAVYSNALLVGEALSASLTIPAVLPLVNQSWRWSLVVWSAPVLAIGLIAAWVSWRRADSHPRPPGGRRWWPDWRDPLTWKLGLIAGFASSLYFATNAFLPDYLKWRGRPDLLGPALSTLNWVQIPASILMILYAARITLKRWPFVTLALSALVSISGMLLMPEEWIVVWAGIIGFCNAFMLILTLALPPLLSESEDVHRLSAAMIAIGYLCAFVVPILGGFLWDATGDARIAFVPLIAFAMVAITLAATLDFSRAASG
jgi:MFS transporter, CP family, cyanate transporter